MAFLPYDTTAMRLLPYEEITEAEYTKIMQTYPSSIDFSKLYAYEYFDTTEAAMQLSCLAAGQDC
jgi:hypothetical protein